MRFLKTTVIAAATIISAHGAAIAQTVDEIIQKHNDAIGGVDNWNKITSMKMVASANMQGQSMTMTVTVVNGRGMRTDFNVMGQSAYTIITPTDGWTYTPGQDKATHIPLDQVKLSQAGLDIKGGQIIDKSKLKSVELAGTDTVNNIPCYKLKATSAENNVDQTVFIDEKTFYIVRTESTAKINDQDVEMAASFSDYKKLPEGIVYPMMMTTQGQDVTFTSIELNKKYDDSLFKPSN
jgi:outer membrane lipoprotein-sorting protein